MVGKEDETSLTEYFVRRLMIAVGILLLVFILNPIRTVDAGFRGVLLTGGGYSGTLGEGYNLIIPIVQQVIPIEVRTALYQVKADSASADLQQVETDIALNYHILPSMAGDVYQKTGEDYKVKIIEPAIQEAVKASTAKYTAEQLITKRELVKQSIDEGIVARLQPFNIIVDQVNIVNFAFSDQFNSAIESKVTAEQNALTAQRNLEKVKFESQQLVVIAQAQADSKLAVAKAEAQSIQLQGEALRNNPQVSQLRAVEKWDGKLPVNMYGGNGNVVPFVNVPLGVN